MARANLRPDAEPSLTAADVLAGAAEFGLQLSGAQADLLVRFAALLVRWNAVHNLTAIRSTDSLLTHHLLDSLVIVPRMSAIFGEQCRVLDVGSGGGLPGIPLVIARPRWQVTLVDKVQKKAAFLTQAKVELGLRNLQCHHARVEELAAVPRFDLIVSRAFSSLEDFVRVSAHVLASGGWWAAMKGVYPNDELADLARAFPEVRVIDVVKLAVPRLDAERHLILLQRP